MKRFYTNSEIKQADERAMAEGTSPLELMERAAKALAERVEEVMRARKIGDALFVCGGGNNGGDGFCAAQILKEHGRDVAVLCLSKKFTPACASAAKKYTGEIFGRIPRRRFALVVDCLFGTGLRSAPRDETKTLIEWINDSGAYVIACDLPSGLTENGIALSPCVCADETVSIGGGKSALLMADGADVSGKIVPAKIGLPLGKGIEVWEDADVGAYFPKRKSHVHKGTFGSACIFADGAAYSGAAFLAAGACLRSGVGLTKLFLTQPSYQQAIGKIPSVVLREFQAVDGEMLSAGCIAMGMGSGADERLYAHIAEILPKYTGTLLLDADALNALGRFGVEILKEKSCRVIVTPHPKEFARLTERSVEDVLAHAYEYAAEFARTYSVTVVLKNNRSLIVDGDRTAINPTGSPALAKGGSGDLLSGLIAGTCARGVPPFEAACVGSYLLGRAGEIAEREIGSYASDASEVLSRIPAAQLGLSGRETE